MRRGILAAIVLGILAIPFLGVRIVPGPEGDGLAARWAPPLWVAAVVLAAFLAARVLPRLPAIPLPGQWPGILGLTLATALPFLPDGWLRAASGWDLGGMQPLGWLSLETLTTLWLYLVLALGLNLIVGQTGVLVLGYGAFYAIGAYSMALLATRLLPYWAALGLGVLLGALLAGGAGVLVGFPALRLKGDYLAIVTLGFGEALVLVLKNWEAVTGGNNGVNITPGMLKSLKGTWAYPSGTWHYGLALGAAVLALVFHARLNRSRIGRALAAVREDETAARAMGIHASRMKLLAFALAAAWAGVAGALFAARQRFITPESFTFQASVTILAMVVLGGMGSLRGVVLGAVLVMLLKEGLREFGAYRELAFGALLVAVMVLRPQGLASGSRETGR